MKKIEPNYPFLARTDTLTATRDREIFDQRKKLAQIWLHQIVDALGPFWQCDMPVMGAFDNLDKIYIQLQKITLKQNSRVVPTFDIAADLIAAFLDTQYGTKRMPTQDEESALGFSRQISSLELADRLSERIITK